MCGRFTLTLDGVALQQAFPQFRIPASLAPRYNIAPTQPVAVVPNDGQRRVDFFLWGLIPAWAKDPRIGNRLINARAETAAQKPSFRAPFRRRRCLILADGFYEWQRAPGGKGPKQPYRILLRDGRPFAFAGLWERWQAPDGSEIYSCTILTTQANPLVAQVHDRMPVILAPEDYDRWLTPGEAAPEVLQPLLRPFPADAMTLYPVSSRVNSPQRDDPDCIRPLTTG